MTAKNNPLYFPHYRAKVSRRQTTQQMLSQFDEGEWLDLLRLIAKDEGWESVNALGLAILKPDAPRGQEVSA